MDIVPSDLQQSINPITSKWLLRVRAVWIALIVILFITFLASIPGAYRMLTTVCGDGQIECLSWGQPTSTHMTALADYSISLQTFAIFNLAIYVAVSLFCWGAGLLVLQHRSRDWYGLLVSYLLIALASGGPSFVLSSGLEYTNMPDSLGVLSVFTIFPLYLALSLFFQTFPDGRIYPRWVTVGTLLILLNYVAWIAPAPLNIEFWSPISAGLWLLFVYGSHVVIQGYRYRYYYSTEQRQQTKWLVYGYGIALTSAIGSGIFFEPALSKLLEGLITAFGFYLPIAVAVTIALLRYRLWDIDIIINRTLVYGLLSGITIILYVLIVGGLGALAGNNRSVLISLLGTGAIAVLFQPLKENIQRAINRLMFGNRDDPMTVVDQLSKGLEAIPSQEAALLHLVETTAKTLKLPCVDIERTKGKMNISYGHKRSDMMHFPLIYQAQIIGHLNVTSRSPGELLNGADRLVLENVARQASNIVYAEYLTSDLQESRQRIVTAREEERRRLRRDLHDSLGPSLATLTLQAEAARDLVTVNPEKCVAFLDDVIDGTQNALADIRRVVYALRPPALDDLGLVAAIREQAIHCSNNSLAVTVDAPETLPPLLAAVEVAAYRIIQEALINVTRHAEANLCRVCLQVNGKMEIEVADNGKGIPMSRRAGVGLNSMHERASELGGSCVIESVPGKGTQIKVLLPSL